MDKKKKIAVFVMLLGICLPSLSTLFMQDSIETSIRQHAFVFVDSSAQVTVTEGALAGKVFHRQRGRVAVPYAYIFAVGAGLILIGGFVYVWSFREEGQIPQYKYYRDY
jgi:predicted MFS family arabinose efflux permease